MISSRLDPSHLDLRVWPPTCSPALQSSSWINARIDQDARVGRFVTATADLAPGSLVLSEKQPYAKILSKERRSTHCANCFQALPRRIPCRNRCRWRVTYCSLRCEKVHWNKLHRWLCQLDAIDRYDDTFLLAFHAYTIQRTIPNLVSHMDTHWTSEVESFASIFYLPFDAFAFILGQVRSNSFAIQSRTDDATLVKQQNLGTAVYLNASMFNHACNPNAVVMFSPESALSVRTTHSIPSGSEISISYGPLAVRQSTEQRQLELQKKYHFQCQCDACLSGAWDRCYKCRGCKAAVGRGNNCTACGRCMDWNKIYKLEKSLNKIDLEQALRLQQELYVDKAYEIGRTCDRIAKHYADLGLFDKAALYCEKSLEIICKHFGPSSIEAAEESFKLCTLLFNDHNIHPRRLVQQVEATINLFKRMGLDQQTPNDYQDLLNISQQSQRRAFYLA